MGDLPFRPTAASSYADDVDRLFFVLVALTVLFSTLVGGLLIFLAVRYKRGSKVDRSRPSSHNTLLELSWTVPPLFLALGVFFWSAKVFTQAYAVPENAKEIFVIGKQWMWHLQHSNGIRENNELHIPVGEPVKLTMISQDVIHAFYVPEFRIQRQVEPGQYSSIYFTPTKTGRYHLYCNMYCGTQHSIMGGWVYVMSKSDYQKWTGSGGGSRPVASGGTPSKTGGLTMTQRGSALYEKYQCGSCHDPAMVQRGRGPSLVGLYGKMRQLADGRKVKADDGYLRNVLYFPAEYPLAGWAVGMPSYKGVLTEEEVLQVNAYVKSLKAVAPSPAAPAGPAGAGAPPAAAGASQAAGAAPGTAETQGGTVDPNAPAANTDNQQFRYMYGGEQ